ncbi:hypothetical protein MTO96_035463 [Rhipicephalus appendiculatus]|uniref:Pancreatic trypsin inhibitor n=1 Tax=Rhipicephalus appendiculatus TaxID=34631 RepID=A0A131YVB0_RHIAP
MFFRSARLVLSFAIFVHAQTKQQYICRQSPDPGNGTEHWTRWFYHHSQKVCKLFIYTGSGGNPNRFSTERHCVMGCVPPGHTHRLVCSRNSYVQRCLHGPQWFFNSSVATCQKLQLYHCATSNNKFPTCVSCMHRCTDFDASKACQAIFRALPEPGRPE